MAGFFFGAGRQYKDPTWRRKGKRAYMRFYDAAMNPTRKEIALGTSSKATAAARFHELKRQYMLGQYDPWRDHASLQMPLEKAIRSYVAEEHIRSSTRKSRRVRLSPFARENPGIYVSGISGEMIKTFCFREELESSTEMRYLSEFRQFLDYCRKKGWVQVNRATEVMDALPRDRKRVLRKAKPFLSQKQFGLILRALEHDLETRPAVWGRAVLRDVFIFAVMTGLRRGEICHLRWQDIDLKIPPEAAENGSHRYGWLVVRGYGDHSTKTGHEDRIPLNRGAYEILLGRWSKQSHAEDQYVFLSPKGRSKLDKDWVSKCFTEYRRLAMLPDGLTFHSLRHTHASWHAEGGTDIRAIQLLLRHSSIKYTLQYAHLGPNALAEKASRAMDHIDFSAP